MKKLAAENELLGMYVSGHPLDEYPEAKKLRTSTIGDAEDGAQFVTFCGVIQKLAIKQRKKDKKPMAFFTLEDETGKAEVCCFTSAYEDFGHLLEENIVVAVDGRFSIEEETDDDGEVVRVTKKVSLEEVHVLKPKPKKILVSAYGLPLWTEKIYPQIVPYSTDDGSEVVFYDTALGEFRTTYLRVSRDILQAEIDDADIIEADI
jgi:DNA polymerase-3 subunit alpha